jgi:hypothetical protein
MDNFDILGNFDNVDNKNIPNGGFPPITECSVEKINLGNTTETKKNRELVGLKVGVSIKDIMAKRSLNQHKLLNINIKDNDKK